MDNTVTLEKLRNFWIFSSWEGTFMPKEYEGNIYHYTSPQGMMSILFDAEPSEIVMWASRYDCMNDMSEGRSAEEVYREVCKELKDQGEITDDFYNIVKEVTPAQTKSIPWIKDGQIKSTRVECDSFICSFSKNKDSLPMWNYYVKGDHYEGFNLGFWATGMRHCLDKSFEDKVVSARMYPVIYDKDEQKELVRKLLLALQKYHVEMSGAYIRTIISIQLTNWKLIFKTDYFGHEEEVRIIVDVGRKTNTGDLQEKPLDIKYRTNHGMIIPYIELHFDPDFLTAINVGPVQATEFQKKAQKRVLKERLAVGNYVASVGFSSIPVRF